VRHSTLILIVLAFISMTALLFAQSQTPRTTTRTPQATSRINEQRLQRTITTQQRLNRYFHSNVIPKLQNCWNHLRGAGTIQINHNYVRTDNGRWAVKDLTVGRSTLPQGQETLALRCMQEAVGSSSFPVSSDDGDSKEYVVKWTWPVPLPANLDEQARVMFAAKGSLGASGCGNTAPNCVDCANTGLRCIDVCNGYHSCQLVGGACQASYRCTTGSPFSVAGSTVLY